MLGLNDGLRDALIEGERLGLRLGERDGESEGERLGENEALTLLIAHEANEATASLVAPEKSAVMVKPV